MQKTWLHNFIMNNCYKEGKFTLASGKQSDYYFNLKPFLFHPRTMNITAELIWEMTRHLGIDCYGGIEIGAIPITLATICHLDSAGIRGAEGFVVRKAPKEHGTCQIVEGCSVRDKQVCILEDVVTTGDSTMHAVTSVQDAGGIVKAVIPILCRNEGGRERFQASGYKYNPLFVVEDFRQ